MINRLLYSPLGLRNGWWILLFLALMLASRLIYTPISRAVQGLGLPAEALEPLRLGMLLLVTWLCVRLRRESLASVGFRLDRRWGRELVAGASLGLAAVLLAVSMLWAMGAVRLELDPARSLSALLYGAYLFLFVAVFEETLFRGFVFQRLVAGSGVWVAQISLGLLFASSHWGNPAMSGATLFWASTELFLGAVLLGLAYLRTRSLALPIGIHLGWNWAQGHLVGFAVSGFDYTGWFRPRLQDQPEWLTGGEFGLEASLVAVLVDLVVLLLLWRWKGSAPRTDAAAVAPAAARSGALPQGSPAA